MEMDESERDWHTELAAQYTMVDMAVQDEESARQHVPDREQHQVAIEPVTGPPCHVEKGSCCDAATAGMERRYLEATEPKDQPHRLAPGCTTAELPEALGRSLEEKCAD
jgi:hypothetical protein